jgi:hypothetical protein
MDRLNKDAAELKEKRELEKMEKIEADKKALIREKLRIRAHHEAFEEKRDEVEKKKLATMTKKEEG